MHLLERFQEVWVCDFEFISKPGERPIPICLVALEIRSGAKLRLWRDQFRRRPPFEVGPDILFVAYYASAELGCFLSLRWPMPVRILDLFVEFRNLTNGLPTVAGKSLLGALTHFGLDGIGTGESNECVNAYYVAGPGQEKSSAKFWTTVNRTSTLWAGCCLPCCHKLICRGLCTEGDTWQPSQRWSLTVCPSARSD